MKKTTLLITILISLNLLSGCDLPKCDVCTDNCYSFEDITNYSIDQITFLNCHLSPLACSASFHPSKDPQFIYNKLDTTYVPSNYIMDWADFDILIYLRVGDVDLDRFIL